MKIIVSPDRKIYLTSNNKALQAEERCGMTLSNFVGTIDSNGVLQKSQDLITPDFTGVEDIGAYGLYYQFVFGTKHNLYPTISFPDLVNVTGNYALSYCFYQNGNIMSVSFPELVGVSGSYAFSYTFSGAAGLTSVLFPKLESIIGQSAFTYSFTNTQLQSLSFPALTTVSGSSAMSNLIYSNSAIGSVNFPELVSISGSYCFSYVIYNNSSIDLKTLSFPKLTTVNGDNIFTYGFASNGYLETVTFTSLDSISGSNVFTNCFSSDSRIKDIYFPALKTTSFGNVNQFNNMFNSSTANTSLSFTMHFPSNLSSTIAGLTGYPNFGATSGRLTLSFDLPATS